MTKDTNIIEIFSSVQGEGQYVGCRQIFIRFALCNLKCLYCDTAFKTQKYCNLEEVPTSGKFAKIENPISSEKLISIINEFDDFNHHSISLTGGEPLLNTEFLKSFLKILKKQNPYTIYLETNGTLYNNLEEVIDLTDIISMDIKLESSTNAITPWDSHKKFIEVATKYNKELFTKIVVTTQITNLEIQNVIELIKNQPYEIPVILQPVDSKDKKLIPDSKTLVQIQDTMLEKLDDVRIIPQTHKFLNLI